MLIASTCGLASTVETRYDLAMPIDHLALSVYSHTSDRIVAYGRAPGRVERWSLDLVQGCGLLKILILPHIDKGVVSGNRRYQILRGHGNLLIDVPGELPGQLLKRVRYEEVSAGDIDNWRGDIPFLLRYSS